MCANTCGTCRFFIQHYAKRGRQYTDVYCGHCIYPRIKTRHADTPACPQYKMKEK